ncbi:MAG: hypothetical protein J6X18_01110 [Bacteroidales bacterium]|nr:hypothetical protein [Bacteroidales bacterium]
MDTILKLNGKAFCVFCGQEITPIPDGQLICQCEDAQLYRKALRIKLQLDIEASNVMNQAPKPKYALQTILVPVQDCLPSHPEEDIPSPEM